MFEFMKRKPKVTPKVTPKVDKPKPKVDEPKHETPPNLTYVRFTGWSDKTWNRGVLLDTRETRALDQVSKVNVILVTHRDGKRITPAIKWINESFCTEITPYTVSHIAIRDFDPKNWDLIKGHRK